MEVIPGYRTFKCKDCGLNWRERTRDCHTPSLTSCPNFGEVDHPENFGEVFPEPGQEEHPEWKENETTGVEILPHLGG